MYRNFQTDTDGKYSDRIASNMETTFSFNLVYFIFTFWYFLSRIEIF